MTHTTEQDRAAFEAKFKVPPGVTWELGMYLVEHAQQGSYQVERFLGQWEGWQAARRAPAVPVPQGLREAAQAVVARWDTPLWKDVPATAVYIADLRAALAAAPQPPEARDHTT